MSEGDDVQQVRVFHYEQSGVLAAALGLFALVAMVGYALIATILSESASPWRRAECYLRRHCWPC